MSERLSDERLALMRQTAPSSWNEWWKADLLAEVERLRPMERRLDGIEPTRILGAGDLTLVQIWEIHVGSPAFARAHALRILVACDRAELAARTQSEGK